MFAKGIAEQAAKEGADPSKVHSAGVGDDAWIKIQQKTFTNWVNSKLAEHEEKSKIEDLNTDFGTGVQVIQLLEVCAGKKVGKYTKTPKMKIHRVENLNKAISFCKDENLTLVNIGASDLESGNLKLVLGFLWTIIYNYQVLPSLKASGGKKVNAKNDLLEWVNSVLCPKHKVTNFTTDWNDGVPLCCLVNAVGGDPPIMPEESDMARNANGVENCKRGINNAYTDLGIPKLIAAEDMSNPAVDEKSMMMYISYFKNCNRIPRFKGSPQKAPEPEPAAAAAAAPEPEPEPTPAPAAAAKSAGGAHPMADPETDNDTRPGAPKRSGKLQIYYSSTTSSRVTRGHNELLRTILTREQVPASFSTWIPVDLDEFRPLRDEIFEKAGSRNLPICFLNGLPWCDIKKLEELNEDGGIHDFFSGIDYS